MRARLSSLTAAVVACVLAGTTPALAGGSDPRGSDPRGSDRHRPAATVDGHQPTSQWRPLHSSDGEPGPIAAPIPTFLRPTYSRSSPLRWQVVPGVRYAQWDQRDARGPIRAHLLTVDPKTPGLRLDYASKGSVRHTAPVTDILKVDHAIAGVNGDFYDIGDTGAPLGLGRDRQRGVLHGRKDGWNSAFYLDARGVPQIGTLPMEARIAQHPGLTITNVNSPFVKPDGIGVYSHSWGKTAGYRVTDGQRRDVRAVDVRHGRVVRSQRTLSHDAAIPGQLLIGRGTGARQLRLLHRGARVNVRWRLAGNPRVAISGNKLLVDDGVIRVVDDRELHPRTAVGIDRDTGEVLMLAIDGRQRFSRGATLVEMANLMVDLGADEALNLDGGGSTTMVARRPSGTVGVVNTPSDGFQRWVSNALEVTYTRPS